MLWTIRIQSSLQTPDTLPGSRGQPRTVALASTLPRGPGAFASRLSPVRKSTWSASASAMYAASWIVRFSRSSQHRLSNGKRDARGRAGPLNWRTLSGSGPKQAWRHRRGHARRGPRPSRDRRNLGRPACLARSTTPRPTCLSELAPFQAQPGGCAARWFGSRRRAAGPQVRNPAIGPAHRGVPEHHGEPEIDGPQAGPWTGLELPVR